MAAVDKIFWVFAHSFWGAWRQSLVLVNPETVVRWHRAGFRLYWGLISKARRRVGRKLSKEVRDLIFQMVAENPTWGAPRIHGELIMLGFTVSERTISRWMKQAPRDPQLARQWLSFSSQSPGSDCGHGLLHRANDRLRRPPLLLCHRPRSPAHPAFQHHETSDEQLDHPAVAGGISVGAAPRFLIHDRDAKYGTEFRRPFDP